MLKSKANSSHRALSDIIVICLILRMPLFQDLPCIKVNARIPILLFIMWTRCDAVLFLLWIKIECISSYSVQSQLIKNKYSLLWYLYVTTATKTLSSIISFLSKILQGILAKKCHYAYGIIIIIYCF